MMRPGTIAWASAAPGFHPPSPHPILCVVGYPNGLVGVAYITHSADLLHGSVTLTRREAPSAFRDRGGPLTDESSAIALVDHLGHKRIVNADPIAADRLLIGRSFVSLSHIVQLPDAEWQPLRAAMRKILGIAGGR